MPRGTGRLDEARLQQRLWTPYCLAPSQVKGWLDPSDLSTITIDGSGNVSQINSKIGSTNAVQATAGNRPGWSPTAWNGRGCLNNTNTTRWLTFDVLHDVFLCVATGTSLQQQLVGGAANGPDFYFYNGTMYLDKAGVVNYCAITPPTSGRHIFGYNITGVSAIYVDGKVAQSGPTSTITIGSNILFINRDFTNYSYVLPAGELLFLSGVSTDDRQRCEGYLAWKWGIVDNLSGVHPYKNRPPLIGG